MVTSRLLLVAGIALLLAGCNAWQTRSEFAPPQSRWPSTLSSTAHTEDPPPPIAAEYCYHTLARVDCFTEPRPERVTGYSGLYPDPDGLPQSH
ncbi:MAG TPA: hypothetical protein VLX85_00225 [Stellaceae bacterium]|nr:hypothetical protein [Stellaceae bacterium]